MQPYLDTFQLSCAALKLFDRQVLRIIIAHNTTHFVDRGAINEERIAGQCKYY